MSLASSRYQVRYLLALLVTLVLTAVAFWPALSGGFIFDDYPIFAENPVAHVTWNWQSWQALWTWSHANIQRPLAMFSYALNYALGGETWGFKAVNLALHLLNTVLVWLLSRRLLVTGWALSSANQNTPARQIDFWAIGLTLAWAIHPLQVSTVMYVVQRMELMGYTFTLLALLAYWRARRLQQMGQYAWPWLLLCGGLTLIGYYAKETAVLVAGYAFLLELTVLRFAAYRPAVSRAWKVAYALAVISAIAIFLGYLLPHYATASAYADRGYSAWQRELTQLRVLPMYLDWSLLPLPSRLYFYYDNYSVSTSLLDPISTLLGGLFLIFLLSLALWMRHRRPLLALGIGWFFVAQTLTSSPLPLELVFEHRNYPALFGVLLAITDLLWLIQSRLQSRLIVIIAPILILNLAVLTTLRAATWGNPLLLSSTLAQNNPDSSRAALDLARHYIVISGDDPQKPIYALGIRELQRAAALPSSTIMPEDALLIQAANHPGLDSAPLWASLENKLRTRPLGPETYLVLSGLLQARFSSNVNIDVHQLARAYAIAVARDPSRIGLHVQYAELAYRGLHDPALAIDQWQQAVALQKDSRGYSIELTKYLIDNQRGQEAQAVIAKAQALQPSLLKDPELIDLYNKAKQQIDQTQAAQPSQLAYPHPSN
ncbi:hypothetical protein ACFONN_02225 [Dyella humi]|uniref:Tetratricopeptide repeat protein n=1 Tax=Dyella humi TaxID=1770547 RepID=A0ABW8ICW8_9GAMM